MSAIPSQRILGTDADAIRRAFCDPAGESGENDMKKRALIIGAGPAGLTAAYELLRQSDEYEVIVFEESEKFGGISRTVEYHGNRMDMGGHRFFSKVPEVNKWWDEMLPRQGAPAADDIALNRPVALSKGGPDPQKEDRVMLRRNRVSRILFNQKFFDYPISLKYETFANMGLVTTMEVGFSYLRAKLFPRREDSLEDFYVNRFGKKLYSMFFEHYTENLWGRHPSEIDPSWGAQRVKGVSVAAVLKDALGKMFHLRSRRVETSLIVDGDVVISSMPIKDLVAAMNDVPADPARIAAGLPYRDYMTVGVLIDHLNLENKTKRKTIGNIVPDNWVYVHDRSVKMGRFQIYNNWSPYLVRDLEHTVWMGLEYFCNEGDSMWNMTDDEFARMGISEMVRLGLISNESDVKDYHVERVKKAYPAYFDTYEEMDTLRGYLNTIPNLFCVGRNGQHRYNNIDHSMCTSFETVKDILSGTTDHSNVWNVNTEQEYHESKEEENTAEID